MLRGFFPSYVSIFLESSKTDQLRQGAWIVIARSGQPTCPVKTLEHYIVAAQIDMSDDSPLFRSLRRSKDSQVRGITYTRAREIVKEALQGFNYGRIEDCCTQLALGGCNSSCECWCKRQNASTSWSLG